MVRGVVTTLALMLALPAGAQVYRCEVDGVVSFSDRPCGPDSALYTDGGGVSYVTPDESLPALAEAAQEFIRERRERITRRDAARRKAPADPASTVERRVETIYVPWATPPATGHRWHRPRGKHDREPRGPVIAGNDRYSPLHGPLMGTQPETSMFTDRNGRRDGRTR
jgi:hypothetical protein